MSMRQISKARRTAAAVTAAVALTLALAACGSDGDKPDKSSSAGQSSTPDNGGAVDEGGKGDPGSAKPQPDKVLATLKGESGMELDITAAVRDSGGFVTVQGNMRNTTDDDFNHTSDWSGSELEISAAVGGGSLAGATFVDSKEKKRYYVLRDTENRPLVTTLSSVEAKATVPVFMQFPAPPETVNQVTFSLPTFQSVTLRLGSE
ncbi:hypothetical protein HRW16_32655 [Streptomyces lunaelactis]|nr:hypothetical protein [Streptomyces lunaelactis]NUK17728.1 hypothetical protein [Streptomyces lunaelactis]NUK38504.1 hypothetical protein [Streptomyces lunaelactis]NUK60163.1 hypothetical protein [Streptomyces lunaelactis]NUK96494.1 hypothetical protein [Streptomyces lunaelactis]